MTGIYRKILIIFTAILVMGYFNTSFAQKEEIIITYDTIVTPKSKKVKIVRVRTVPKFVIHVNASYNSGAMELTGHNGGFSRADYIEGKNFGARHGFGFNLIGKLPLRKKGDLWLDFITGFDRFQSDLIAKNTEEGRATYNSFSGGVGLEYDFTSYHKVKYYLGFNPLLSVITGKSWLINPDNNRIDINIKSSVRLGYSAFFGLEYAFEKDFGVNLSIEFTHANLLLKNSEPAVEESNAVSTVGLNDDASTSEIQFAGWKQFAYFSGSVGFSYFFGVKERRYKVP